MHLDPPRLGGGARLDFLEPLLFAEFHLNTRSITTFRSSGWELHIGAVAVCGELTPMDTSDIHGHRKRPRRCFPFHAQL